jgi:HD-GYP domain-containing protein (c-di-GMP phosphodiesterase class II)
MAENYQSSHLSTADIAQKTEEDRYKPEGEMEHEESRLPEERFIHLLPSDEAEQLRSCWNAIQTEFVDDPETSVEAADSLVAQVMQRLAEIFAEERKGLESQWQRGQEVSTEDLRIALQRYRSFFNRLLSLQ